MNILYLVSRPMWAQMYGIRNGLIANGHNVITAAPNSLPHVDHIETAMNAFDPDYKVDIACESDEPISSIVRRMSTEPDLIFYIENMIPFLPKGIMEIDIPTVGLFSEDTKNSDWETYLLPHFDIAPRLTMQAVRNAHKLGYDNAVYWFYGGADYYHADHGLERDIDLVFLGNFSNWHPERTATLPQLLKLKDEGYEVEIRQNVFFDDYAYWHSRAKVTYNVSQEACYLNFRVFEAMSSGCMVVTNQIKDKTDPSSQYFTDREHLVYYNDSQHAVELIREYLDSGKDSERERIAIQGRDHVQSNYSYADMTKNFLDEHVSNIPSDFYSRRKDRIKRLKLDDRRQTRDYARYFYFTGDFRRARHLVERFQTMEVDAGTQNLQGIITAVSGDILHGAQSVVNAIIKQPENPLFHYNMAAIHFIGRNASVSRAETIEYIHKALYQFKYASSAIDSIDISDSFWPQETGRFRLQLARALYHSHSPEKYRQLLASAFQYNLNYMLARVCMETGDWPQSEHAFQQAMEFLGGDDGYIIAEMANLYALMGNTDKAIETIKYAITLEPFHLPAHLSYARWLSIHQPNPESRTYLEDLAKKYPWNEFQLGDIYNNLAAYYYQVDEIDPLRVAWQKILDLNPKYPGIKDRLALLPEAEEQKLGEGLSLTYYGDFENRLQAYPIINHALTRELSIRGVNVQKNAGSSDIAITFFWPPQPPKADHLINIAMFCWEFTSIPDQYVATFNSYDYVITFSENDKQMLETNGVHTPVIVVPMGFDPENFYPMPVQRKDNRFRFLFVGGTNPRHGFDIAIQAFKEEFSPDEFVELVVKVSASYQGLEDELAAGYNIRIVNQFLSPDQMLSLYNASDALLYTVRGAGLGVPALEALACGVPSITTDWSAISEVIDHNKVGYTLVDTPNENGVSSVVPNLYAEPSIPEIRQQMRAIFNDPETARLHTEENRQRGMEEFSYAAASRNIIEFFRSIPEAGNRVARLLEIGPGNNPHKGYELLDIREDLPGIDWVHDFNEDLPFEENTFDEILSSHSIEHVSWREVIDTLRDWARVIRPGGKARIYTPDFEYLCKKYAAGESDSNIEYVYPLYAEQELGGYNPATWAIIKMFAGQEYDANFHYGVYDFATLSRFLKLAGFAEVHRLPFVGDIHLEAIKEGPPQILHRARNWILEGKFQQAIEELQPLVENTPNIVDVHVELGVAYLCAGDPVSASSELEKAIALEPRSIRAKKLLDYAQDRALIIDSSPEDNTPNPSVGLVLSGSRVLAETLPPSSDRRWVPLNQREGKSLKLANQPAEAEAQPAPKAKSKSSRRQPKISVLLCSYNRKDRMVTCIDALNQQTLPVKDYEIILVDDGSTDGTDELIPTLKSRARIEFLAHKKNRGLAAARNTAISAAQGKYLLFINDDTYPEPGMLEAHVRFLDDMDDPNLASLGRIEFIEPIRNLAVSESIEHYNMLFPYNGIRMDRTYDFDYFVTGNVAVGRHLFVDHDLKFNETFERYGCEDIELGLRLWQQGMRVHFNPKAVAQHEHLMSAAAYYRREVANAFNQVMFIAMHPVLIRRYWQVPALTQGVADKIYKKWEKFEPQLETLIAELEKFEHQPVEQLVGQNILGNVMNTPQEVIETIGQAILSIGSHGRNRGYLEAFNDLPGMTAQLAGQTIVARDPRGTQDSNIERDLKLSIVIPTYNRKDKLVQCLQALGEQTLPFDQYEVIVIDDGSTDGTLDYLENQQFRMNLRYFQQNHSGPAAARNLGVTASLGDVVLFIGDDIYAPTGLLKGHLDHHHRYPDPREALLGHIDWYSQGPVPPFMECIVGESGIQFGFKTISDPEQVDYVYFYTSNISLKRDFIRSEKVIFDTDYYHAAWEDIDLGYRLSRRGLRLRYRSYLAVHHDHPTTVVEFRKRQFHAGQMARIFAQKNPNTPIAQQTVHLHAQALQNLDRFIGYGEDIKYINQALSLEEAYDLENADSPDLKELESAYEKVLGLAYARGVIKDELDKRYSAFGSQLESAQQTLELLLNAEDLTVALNANKSSFNDAFIAVIRNNIDLALMEGEIQLAEGLTDLENYVSDSMVEQRIHRAEEQGYIVDIIIPIYGQAALLKNCVESVLSTTDNAQLILVDDQSPGEEIQALFETWKELQNVTLVTSHRNVGFIGACKLGASLSNAEYLLFLNSDTKAIEPGWLEALIPTSDDVAITGAKLLYPVDMPGPLAGCIQHAGIARNSEGVPYHPFLGLPEDTPEVNKPREVNAVTGACYLVRRSVWDELGGWDENFGRGVYEDVDFSWQARKKGYKVLYIPKARLYHYESASKTVDGRHLLNENTQQNLQYLLGKWKSLSSDEILFFSDKTIRKWERGRKWVNRSKDMVTNGQVESAISAMENALSIAPDLPEALIGYAQLMSQEGQHEKAIEHLVTALQNKPANWDARLLLVDEYITAGDPKQAKAELDLLHQVHPNHPKLLQRQEMLSLFLMDETPAVVSNDTAARTLEMILEADDIIACLTENQDKLDRELYELVCKNVQIAKDEGEIELASGLGNLADYIESVLVAE